MNKYNQHGIIIVLLFTLLYKIQNMSRQEHFNIFAGIILVSAFLTFAEVIHGFEIIAFSTLSIVGLYLALFFVKYVYEQKSYSSKSK